jgi:hypothetical protein
MDAYVTPLYAFRARRKGYEVSVMKEMMNILGHGRRAPCGRRSPMCAKEEIAELKAMLGNPTKALALAFRVYGLD